MEREEYKEYLEKEVYPNYKKEQIKKLQLLSTSIIPMRPDLGYFINVNGHLEISEKVFPDEYKQILKAFNSVVNKLEKEKQSLSKV